MNLSSLSYLMPPLIAAAVTLGLLLVAVLWSRRDITTRVFSGFLLSMAVWNVLIFSMRSSPDVQRALLWDRGMVVASMAAFVFYYHFTLVYTNTRGQRRFLLAAYLLLLVFVALLPSDLFIKEMQVQDYGYAPVMGLGTYIMAPIGLLLLIGGAINLLRCYRLSPSREDRTRIVLLVVAALLPFIGGILDGFTKLPPLAIWSNLLFTVLCSVAVLRYHLLDIRVFLRRSIVYLLVSIVVAVPYVGILLLSREIMAPQIEAWWIHAILLLILAIILRPLYGWAQRLADKFFYRERYGYVKALEQFSKETQSIGEAEKLGSTLIRLISGALGCSSAGLLLPSQDNRDLVLASHVGMDTPPSGAVLRHGSRIVKWFEHNGEIISSRELKTVPEFQSLADVENQNLQSMQAELCVPARNREGRLLGILVLGKKLGRQAYDSEDMQVLSALRGPIAMTLENAQLYRDSIRARENLEAWLNSMSDCVLIIDANFTIRFANRTAQETLGVRLGQVCWEALGGDALCPECPIEQYLHGDSQGLQYTTSIEGRDYDVASAPLMEPDGTMSLIAVMRDVTERALAEEALRRERDFAQSVLGTAQAIILILDPNGRIAEFNPYMEEVSGYRLEEVQGKDWFDTFVPERDRERIRKLFRQAFGGIRTRGNINQIVTRDGREREIEWYDKTLEDMNGNAVGLLAIGQDVTERRQADRALLESEVRFRRLFEESNDAVFIHDLDGNIHDVNTMTCEMLGCSKDVILSMKLLELHPEEELARSREAIRATAETGSTRFESRFRRADGSLVDVDISSRIVDPEKGLVQKVVRDITERKRAEEALRDLSRRLVRTQEDERRSIARELHDQTGQLLAYLSLLLDKCRHLPADSIDSALRETKTVVTDLIDHVRNLSLNLRPSTLDDMGLLETLLSHCERYTSQTQIQVDFKHTGLPEKLPPDVSITTYRIVQEGLTNVARHAKVDKVKVHIRAGRDVIRVKIEDRGAGFVPGQSRASGGLGMMQERAYLLGGKLKVESSPGAGTSITAELPLSDQSKTR